ncbi:hypothetical protein AGMMS49531_04290 [Endomicrobiia bacterium]|nr:hypothetical protein AGMMS49531_04290 [Endomicrobiia bacterium]
MIILNNAQTDVPIIEGLAKKYKGSIAFAKCNTDKNAKIGSLFTVISLPSFA